MEGAGEEGGGRVREDGGRKRERAAGRTQLQPKSHDLSTSSVNFILLNLAECEFSQVM